MYSVIKSTRHFELEVERSDNRPEGPVARARIYGKGTNPEEKEGRIVFVRSSPSYEDVEKEVQRIKKELDEILACAKKGFEKKVEPTRVLSGDLSPEEIWEVLTEYDDVEEMFSVFNSLAPETRQAVANHVLTQLNVFKGDALIFSIHYNVEKNILE
nr:hypothetical protein [Desulfobacterales bacterium]